MGALSDKQFSPYITPERRHEVENAMPPVYVGASRNEATPEMRPGNMGKAGHDAMIEQHHVARTIMQSAVPVADLAGISMIRTAQRLSGNVAARHVITGVGREQILSGQGNEHIDSSRRYSGQLSKASQKQGHAETHPRRSSRNTYQRDLVHEIGHHVDYQNNPEGAYRSQPLKEAYAENYADAHVRTNVPETSSYDYNLAHGNSGFSTHGNAVYRNNRDESDLTPDLDEMDSWET
jgi:hypothetical protein